MSRRAGNPNCTGIVNEERLENLPRLSSEPPEPAPESPPESPPELFSPMQAPSSTFQEIASPSDPTLDPQTRKELRISRQGARLMNLIDER